MGSPTPGIDRRSFLKAGALVALGLARPFGAGAVSPRSEPVSLARVLARGRSRELSGTFDLTEHGRDGWLDIVLWPGDRRRLEALGFRYEILVADLAALDEADRAAERAAAASDPGFRVMYRTLAEYEADLRALEQARPDIARVVELPAKTHQGRRTYALEIAGPDVEAARIDGRPVAYVDGLHHAREWPSGELPMMFAQDLVDEFGKGTPEIVDLLNAIRVLIVPVVNPDGFARSRETVSDFLVPLPGATAVAGELAYHRKNMRRNGSDVLELAQGVDVNRNYPFRWSGPGSSENEGSQTFCGPGPASEPETQNVASLVRRNHIVTMVTNHTYGDLVLRPWGDTREDPPDEADLKALGDAMAAINGYRSQKGIDLYATTGTTDDWLYGAFGGLGFTFEIGSSGATGLGNVTPVEGAGFHPQYNVHIPAFYARNRGAYLLALQAARDPRLHCIVEGTAPAGTVVTMRKVVEIEIGDVLEEKQTYRERFESAIVVGAGGRFEWHVNPSALPTTVARVARGELPASALEPYGFIAKHPDGTVRGATLVALRGGSYTLDLS